MGAKTFEELRAWQCAAESSDRVVAICETPALGHREFAHHLSMARSEIFEVRNDLLALQRRGTLPPEVVADLLDLSERTARTIARLRSSL